MQAVYKHYYGYVKSVVVRYVNNTADVEELINDNFIKVFNKLHTFRFPEDETLLPNAFKAWLSRISSHTAIDFLRLSKRKQNLEELTDETEITDEVTVLEKINGNEILQLLNELPELQRVIFNLFEIEGFSHKEIAAELCIPEKHSRVYLARSKSRLRTLYLQTLTAPGISYEK